MLFIAASQRPVCQMVVVINFRYIYIIYSNTGRLPKTHSPFFFLAHHILLKYNAKGRVLLFFSVNFFEYEILLKIIR